MQSISREDVSALAGAGGAWLALAYADELAGSGHGGTKESQRVVLRNELCFAVWRLLPLADGARGPAKQVIPSEEIDAPPGDLWLKVDNEINREGANKTDVKAKGAAELKAIRDAAQDGELWQEFWLHFRNRGITDSSKEKPTSSSSEIDGVKLTSFLPGSTCARILEVHARLPSLQRQLEARPRRRRHAPAVVHAFEPRTSGEDVAEALAAARERGSRRQEMAPGLGVAEPEERTPAWAPDQASPSDRKRCGRFRPARGFADYKEQKERMRSSLEASSPKPALPSLASSARPCRKPYIAANGMIYPMGEIPPEHKQLMKARKKQCKGFPQEAQRALMTECTLAPLQWWAPAVHEFASTRDWRNRLPEIAQQVPVQEMPLSARLTADFHRPWSRERMECDDGEGDELVSPVVRFAILCRNAGVHPLGPSVKFLSAMPEKLDLRSAGYGPADILALALSMPDEGRLEAADFGENARLSGEAMELMLAKLANNHGKALMDLRLDRCVNIGKDSIVKLTNLLVSQLRNVQKLDLSGINIPMREYRELASALSVHPHLRDVRLAETGLGLQGQAFAGPIINLIVSNRQLESLDVGWNSLDAVAIEALGKGLAEHDRLQRLGLSSASACPGNESYSPLLNFLENIRDFQYLTTLDVSFNSLDGAGPLVLESAARGHPRLQEVHLTGNPLCFTGLRSVVRLLALPGTPLRDVQIEGCTARMTEDISDGLLDLHASGAHTLNMDLPVHRALLCLLLDRLGELCKGSRPGVFLRNACLSYGTADSEEGAISSKPFAVDALRRGKHNRWLVPSSGQLSFELCLDEAYNFERPLSMDANVVIDDIIRGTRLRITDERKMLAVLGKLKSLREDSQRDACLLALAQDFLLSYEQLVAMCHTEVEELNHANHFSSVLTNLLPVILDVNMLRSAVCSMTTIGPSSSQLNKLNELVRLDHAALALLSLDLDNPNGAYTLHLSKPTDRFVAERLLLLNRWQVTVWKFGDHSQHANNRCMRNETYCGQKFSFEPGHWTLPGAGILSWDFMALHRPPASAEPIDDRTWGELLVVIETRLESKAPSLPNKDRRTSLFSPKSYLARSEEHQEGMLGPVEVLWAVRAACRYAWLRSIQLRRFLVLLADANVKRNALFNLFARCVDWPLNGKVALACFSETDERILMHTIGHLNMFSYGQLDNCSFAKGERFLDLSVHEERRVLHHMITLAEAENQVNLKHARMDWHGLAPPPPPPNSKRWEPFPKEVGLPKKWQDFDQLPCRGFFQATYECRVEKRNVAERRNLAMAYGGWQLSGELEICWWSVVRDISDSVMWVVIKIVNLFPSLEEAYKWLDVDGSDYLKRNEFIGLLSAIVDHPLSRVWSGVGQPPPPQQEVKSRKKTQTLTEVAISEDTRHQIEEKLQAAFKWLDSSGDGRISFTEFWAFDAIWKELRQSGAELATLLRRSFGSLEQAWDFLHRRQEPKVRSRHDASAMAIGRPHFDDLCQAVGFAGPARQLFSLLADAGSGSIRVQHFMDLGKIQEPEV